MRLLWVDDDGEERFRYEQRILGARNWEIAWALDLLDAAEKLSTSPFDALVVDQSLPLRKGGEPTRIEGGYTLLHWLRRGEAPPGGEFDDFRRPLNGKQALGENRCLPVLIVSAFFDEDLDAKIRQISPEDQEILIAPKPLDEYSLRSYIEDRRKSSDPGRFRSGR